MKIEDILNEKDVTPSLLTERYGFKAFKSGQVIRVNSAPDKVKLCNADFTASFIFSDNVMKRIILTPLIKDVTAPDYPTPEYQEIKRSYCTDVLCEAFGKPDDEWELSGCKINCYLISEGKDEYCGGNITIEMK